jgi:hypothetical protein
MQVSLPQPCARRQLYVSDSALTVTRRAVSFHIVWALQHVTNTYAC